ncbi:MAG: RNA polymerase sigma factor [Planctomycetota bacterium]
MDDRDLIAQFLASRDEAQFRLLYRRHASALYPLLRRLLAGRGAEVDDAYQECWVRIVERLPRYEGRGSFRAWCAGIALNCAREAQRRPRLGPLLHEPVDAAAAGAAQAAGRLDVQAALAELAQGYREVIVLHDLHGHTHPEVAALLGISTGTSKSQLSRARHALRQLIGEDHAR